MSERPLIPRPLYDKKLSARLGDPSIKVLTGVRRCGKSMLLKMLIDRIQQEGFPPENIFYRRFDEFGMPLHPDGEWLAGELRQALKAADAHLPFRVFLDEIQEVESWEKVVRQLHTRTNTDVFITGSNAYVLSSDLSTFLAGRYTEIDIFPLSFSEYVDFCAAHDRPTEDIRALFNEYMTYGGMPGLFDCDRIDPQSVSEDLSTIFDAVILNDVARRASIRDLDLLNKVVRYVFSTSGSLFSTKRISDALTSAGRTTKPETIDNYLRALQNAFAVYACEQEGLCGKRVLRPLQKLYPCDTGFRNMTTRFSGQDIGYQLENIVYMELLRRGYEVSVGALPHAEIDFVAKRGNQRLYVQVTASLLDERVHEREMAPLRAIGDSFPKVILTLDGWRSGVTDSGIIVRDLIGWLRSPLDEGISG